MSQRKALIPLPLKLFLLFTVVPLVELLLLVWLWSVTSLLFTLAVILVSGFVGAAMARREGMNVWMQGQREMAMGRFPADSMIDGVIVLVGGILLITPGILTDIVGFSTLVPPIRAVYRGWLKRNFRGRVTTFAAGPGGVHVYTSGNAEPRVTASEEAPAGSPFADDSPFAKRDRD